MKIYEITDPMGINYPFDKEIYENALTVYHGTWSTYCIDIENKGFQIGKLPFEWQDIKEIISLHEDIWFNSLSYSVIRGWAEGNSIDREANRAIFFSQSFWNARNYSTFRGGETIDSAIQAIEEFVEFSQNTDAKRQKLQWLKNQINLTRTRGVHKYTVEDFEKCITSLENEDLLSQYRQKIYIIKLKLLNLTANGYPVVYAIKVKKEWFPEREQNIFDMEFNERQIYCNVNLSCDVSIPPENIVAKVMYINGAEEGYCGTPLATWEEAVNFGK